jgi:hypothetical protein
MDISYCRCGAVATEAQKNGHRMWVISFCREGCPALVQSTTKRHIIERWNEMSAGRL